MRSENLLDYQIVVFLILYFLRTLLITGYNHLKFKKDVRTLKLMTIDFIKVSLSLAPLMKRKLDPKGYDFKIYQRFQKKFIVYYYMMWFILFCILFLSAKIYLNAFS